MAFLCSMIGLVSRKGPSVGCSSFITRKAAAVLCSSWISQKAPPNNLGSFGAGGFSTVVGGISDESVVVDSSSKISSFPWLMLPPEFEEVGGNKNMVYKFYSLAENKVVSFNKKKRCEEDMLGPDDDAKLLGSSHGWLALINQRNDDIFLYNPISGRHIKLPSLDTLPIPEDEHTVGKLIISCSPTDDEENCRAMINYDSIDQHAFCCPGRSTEWTPIFMREWVSDFVYSRRQKLFFCVTSFYKFVALDLQDLRSPREISMDNVSVENENYPWPNVPWSEKNLKAEKVFLVVAEHSDELFFVRRFFFRRIGPDGSAVADIYYGKGRYDLSVPYKTIDFDVHKYDPEERAFKYMDSTLDGLSLFIGKNHGFALRPNDQLKPNSIYFTDLDKLPIYGYVGCCDKTYGGHDLGIFNYENKTFSQCYYPCDIQNVKRIVPPPMWFTPTHQP